MSYPSNINFIGDQINFMNTVNNSRINIFKNFTDSTDSTDLTNDQRNINNMFGMDSGAVLKDNPPNFNTKLDYSNLVQFYGFWGSSDSVSLAKKYVTSLEDTGKTSNNDIQNLTSLRNYNYVVTYILFIFFGNQIVNLSDTTENSFRPDINTQQNSLKFTQAIVNIKNFISQSDGQNTSLLGAGNYKISKPEEQNRGFVYYMCINDIYKFFTEKNKFLLEPGQTLTNDENIYGQLTPKQISFYRKEMSKNPNLASWCGCFAPIPSFLKESKTPNFQTQADSPCDPLCYNRNNIGLYEITADGTATNLDPRIPCNGDICVIDNISIESFGETGQINFNQICTGCKTQNQNCLCFLDVSAPNLVNKITSGPNAMANQVNYVQNCPNSICFKVDDTTGTENIVQCNRFDIPSSASLDGNLFRDGLSSNQYPERITNSIWFALIVALFLFIIYQPKIFFNL